jgi:hypothetical protein
VLLAADDDALYRLTYEHFDRFHADPGSLSLHDQDVRALLRSSAKDAPDDASAD